MNKNIYAAILWLSLGWLACHALRMAGATTIYVATNGVETRTGAGDWTNAVLTISNGVAKATAVNDLVLVSNGEYLLTAQINVGNQITVRSWNNGIADPTNTIVNGNYPVTTNRCFYVTHPGAVLEGLTIYNGRMNASVGAGVYMTAGTLRNCLVVSNSAPNNNGGGVYFDGTKTGLVDNCLMAYNTATNGGGIFFYPYNGGAMLVTNCVMRNNRAVSSAGATAGGGGVWMRGASGSTGVLANCNVYRNEASYCGGGIMMEDATIVKNCVVSNNFVYSSAEGGGGVYMYGGTITNCMIISNVSNGAGAGIYLRANSTIANCRIIGNQMTNQAGNYYGGGVSVRDGGTILNSEIRDNFGDSYGGGILVNNNDNGALILRNCLIAGNVATNSGGGVLLSYFNNVLENCTIVSNRGGVNGGGLYLVNPGTNFIANCIVYLNTAATAGTSNYYNYYATTIGSYSNCCFAPALSDASTNFSANNITADPQFAEKDAGNWRLKKESPCVNAGVNRDWMTDAVDLDGRRRIDFFSGIVDIGCYEYLFSGMMFTVP